MGEKKEHIKKIQRLKEKKKTHEMKNTLHVINRRLDTEEESSVIMNKITKMKQKANWKNTKTVAVTHKTLIYVYKGANLCAVGVSDKKGRGNKKY